MLVKSFHCAMAASDELRESLDAEHHAVGAFISSFYAMDVRPPPVHKHFSFALMTIKRRSFLCFISLIPRPCNLRKQVPNIWQEVTHSTQVEGV